MDGIIAVGLLGLAVGTGYIVLPPRPTIHNGTAAPAVLGATLIAMAPTTADHVPPATAERVPPATDGRPGVRPEPSAPAGSETVPASKPQAASEPRRTWPERITGRVVDRDGRPMPGASVVTGGREIRVGPEGAFSLVPAAPDAPVIVKLPGYEKVTVRPTREALHVVLRPQTIKAAYLTYYGISSRLIRNRVLDLVARSELNAVVIDVKGDRGWIPYRTEVPLALAAGAQGPATIKDFEGMLADFKGRGIYTVARIVAFKDNVLAHHRPDWAVIDTRTGAPWIDREKLAWVDPFREEVWSYNIAIAKEAVRKGFDEVQFDYVRFPTDGRLSAARYSKANNKDTRLPTIAAFLRRARTEVGATGAFVSADVFGYTAFNDNDTDIGQRIEELAPLVDYLCPMVYPSGYHLGIPGFRNPVAHPYEVVRESVRLIKKRSGDSVVRVRPWLQDFRDYAFDRRIFGVSEIRAQIKGADEAGSVGWMLWNPRNDYTGPALRTKGPLASK